MNIIYPETRVQILHIYEDTPMYSPQLFKDNQWINIGPMTGNLDEAKGKIDNYLKCSTYPTYIKYP